MTDTDNALPEHLAAVPGRLLSWYDRNRRRMPWRAWPGTPSDPYRVWLSEIMCQQTTVAAAAPYFEAFTQRWPTVDALAGATLDEVLHAWQGLGYYARARNLHACARTVVAERGGRFPDEEAALRTLPGIGAYTAAAIAAIAFGRKATPVDGNVERVMARLFRVETPLPAAKGELAALAARLTPDERPGDYAQAVMDLGATVCTPRNPACGICPLMDACAARTQAAPGDYPRKAAKKAKPVRHGIAFWARRGDGTVLLRRRPERGLLGGMMEVPSTDWREAAWDGAAARRLSPVPAVWTTLPGTVRHTFTHFHLELTVMAGQVRGTPPADGVWVAIESLGDHALPTVMKKVVRHALKAPLKG